MRTTRLNFPWKNRHETSSTTVARLHTIDNKPAPGSPALTSNPWLQGLRDLRDLVREVFARGGRLRAQGGLWSLSEVARLDQDVVDLSFLNQIDAKLPAAALHPKAQADGRNYVFAQAGVRVVDLHQSLEKEGLALATSGASNGQSLAGAIATGTHGAAVDVGSMQDLVAAIHLIGDDGDTAWVERTTRPVVSDGFLALTQSRRVADDALFAAALVNLGSLGVVHAYVIEAVPRYFLELHVTRVSRDAMLSSLVNGDFDLTPLNLPGGGERPYHVEFAVNPYADAGDADGVTVRVLYHRPWAALPPAGGGVTTAFSADLIADVGKLAHAIGSLPFVGDALLKAAVGFFLKQQIPDAKGLVASPGVHFGDTSLQPGGISTEIGVASTDVRRTLSTLIAVARQTGYAGALSLRFVRPSKATLAFTRHGPLTCTIETPSIKNAGTRAAIPGFWDALTQAGIPFTAHWGQLFPRDAAWVKTAYGDAVHDWRDARNKWLVTPTARRMFSSDFLDLLRLTS